LSDLPGLYAALAAIPVTVDGQAFPVFTPGELPSSLHTAHLPCRLLLAGDARESNTVEALTFGGARRNVWQILDLFLWSPENQSYGLADSLTALDYMNAYADAIHAGTPLDTATTRATVTGVELKAGVFPYPTGSGMRYAGVCCHVTVVEIA